MINNDKSSTSKKFYHNFSFDFFPRNGTLNAISDKA